MKFPLVFSLISSQKVIKKMKDGSFHSNPAAELHLLSLPSLVLPLQAMRATDYIITLFF